MKDGKNKYYLAFQTIAIVSRLSESKMGPFLVKPSYPLKLPHSCNLTLHLSSTVMPVTAVMFKGCL